MFDSFFKKRRIKKYAKKLPAKLKKSYGYNKYYTKEQVHSAAQMHMGITDIYYAYAMFCSPEEFESIHGETGEICDYGEMRTEISDICFPGDSDFTFSSLEYYADSSSGFFSGGNDDFGGGNDDFGGGGGDGDGDGGN